MFLEKLKQEIDLRYNIINYRKLHKQYLYSRFEQNNLTILENSLKRMKKFKLK